MLFFAVMVYMHVHDMIFVIGASLSEPHGCENCLTGRYDRPTKRWSKVRATDKKVELPESLSESRGSPLREQLDRKDHMGATRWRFPEILWYCTLGAMQSVQELETDGLVAGRLRAQGRN